MSKIPAAAVRYCNCMEDIKVRLGLIKEIIGGHSPLRSEGLDGEVVCLLLRRVLEQIAFSSLLAHQELYETAYDDLAKVWRARALVERLAKHHPDFYPKPVRFPRRKRGDVMNLEVVRQGYLTQDDFIFLLDKANDGVHTWNPFKNDAPVINFERSIAEWVQRIERLLNVHWIMFAGTRDIWLIQMDHPEDHKVHAFMAPAVDAPPEDLKGVPRNFDSEAVVHERENFRLAVRYFWNVT